MKLEMNITYLSFLKSRKSCCDFQGSGLGLCTLAPEISKYGQRDGEDDNDSHTNTCNNLGLLAVPESESENEK